MLPRDLCPTGNYQKQLHGPHTVPMPRPGTKDLASGTTCTSRSHMQGTSASHMAPFSRCLGHNARRKMHSHLANTLDNLFKRHARARFASGVPRSAGSSWQTSRRVWALCCDMSAGRVAREQHHGKYQ